jgi:hypothetical protein
MSQNGHHGGIAIVMTFLIGIPNQDEIATARKRMPTSGFGEPELPLKPHDRRP